jgi:two-component system cell cycle sensor histidine kinase/response regulator CckA
VTSRDSADQTPLPGDDDARRFRSAFDNASIGMALVAADGRWLDVNRSFCELIGYDAGQLLRLTEQQLTHPDDRDAGCAQVARALAGDITSYQQEKRYVHSLGHPVWVHQNASLVRADDESNGPLYFINQMQDITERKLAQEALELSEARLAEAEERYRTLVEQLPLVTFIRALDLWQPNIFVSSQVGPMLGYSTEEWESDPDLLATVVHPDDRELVLAKALAVRTSGEPFRAEYRYLARDGRIVWVIDETHLVRDENGEPLYVQGFLVDITERKQAEAERDRLQEELQHAHRLEAIGRLAGGVAHDFNNMLTAIKGYSELLIDRLEPGSREHDEALQIKRAAEQASTLPRQLLAFSRNQVLVPELVEVNTVVTQTAKLLGRMVGSLKLVVAPSVGETHVYVDRGQLEQVIFNLALNARDAMPGGGTLTIATGTVDVAPEVAADRGVPSGRYAFISVTDTGEGMDAETKARVFEPFFTTKPVGEGAGLGLASVYGTVTQSGGFIRLDTQPFVGSTFIVHLPLAQQPGGRDVPVEDARPVGATPRALVVDDEEMVRELAVSVLERAGFDVESAANGIGALELVRNAGQSFDVLVTDVSMPGMGGRQLAVKVAELDPQIRVVFMSGYSDEILGSGPDEGALLTFLAKPFSPRTLVKAVREALGLEPALPLASAVDGEPAIAVTCVIADDHPAVLDSVSRYLGQHGVDVIAVASRGDEALQAIEELGPDVAVLDIAMEPLGGIEIARQIAQTRPDTRAILYTGHADREYLAQALDAGARGFVLKESPLADLVRAISAVAGGRSYVDPGLAASLTTAEAVASLSPLTPREREVLTALADGMTNERAGALLGIAAETIQSHVRNAMAKLEADTRTEAVAIALRHSFIP